jgi:signal transduction histidine kinase
MRERVAQIDGRLEIDSGPGRTRVRAVVPFLPRTRDE